METQDIDWQLALALIALGSVMPCVLLGYWLLCKWEDKHPSKCSAPRKPSLGEGPFGYWGYDEDDHWQGPGHSST